MASDTITIELPRSALTIIERPRAVSQLSCEHVLGLPRRPFLEAVRDFERAGGDVMKVGKLRMVELDPFLRWLSARSEASSAAPAPAANDAVDPVDDLAAELGLVALSGAR